MSTTARKKLRPDAEKLRREFEDEKRRVREAGDDESIQRLEALERASNDEDFWKQRPSVLEQLGDHLKRLGIK